MAESSRIAMEITFNLAYLAVIWGVVLLMGRRRSAIPEAERPLADLFLVAFGMLALGDTGHVGFRVLAYAQGDLGAELRVGESAVGLVGLGALATAFTVTLFYLVLLVAWRRRFRQPYGLAGSLLFTAAAARFLLMLPAANQWDSVVPPQPWSLLRNLPLTILGLGVAYLVLRHARDPRDRAFTWLGALILVSYAFYIPVILFVQRLPWIGMLMIPKTLAYVAMAFVVYNRYFKTRTSPFSPHSSPV